MGRESDIMPGGQKLWIKETLIKGTSLLSIFFAFFFHRNFGDG